MRPKTWNQGARALIWPDVEPAPAALCLGDRLRQRAEAEGRIGTAMMGMANPREGTGEFGLIEPWAVFAARKRAERKALEPPPPPAEAKAKTKAVKTKRTGPKRDHADYMREYQRQRRRAATGAARGESAGGAMTDKGRTEPRNGRLRLKGIVHGRTRPVRGKAERELAPWAPIERRWSPR
jgi:hypothetical protein